MASQAAVTEERSRLAREIHDTLAQAFAGIILQAGNLEFSLSANDAQVKSALERIQELARSGLDEARRAVCALRPQALEGCSLPQALERAAKSFSNDHGVPCEFRQIGQAWPLTAPVEDELFRIAQEAMTNVQKHAQATAVSVEVDFRKGQVTLTVRDNGVGFVSTGLSARRPGHGLKIMRERAQHSGGSLDLESPAAGGVVIRVRVPSTEGAKRPRFSNADQRN